MPVTPESESEMKKLTLILIVVLLSSSALTYAGEWWEASEATTATPEFIKEKSSYDRTRIKNSSLEEETSDGQSTSEDTEPQDSLPGAGGMGGPSEGPQANNNSFLAAGDANPGSPGFLQEPPAMTDVAEVSALSPDSGTEQTVAQETTPSAPAQTESVVSQLKEAEVTSRAQLRELIRNAR